MGTAMDLPTVLEPNPNLRTKLLKARGNQCRFIVSDDAREAVCCGAPTPGLSSWCAWHQRIVFAKASISSDERQEFKLPKSQTSMNSR
jgi:hypothetical protein